MNENKPPRAIAPSMAAPTRPHGPTDAPTPPNCIACGAYHGSVGVAKACLELEILRLRALVPEKQRRP
jgi:hypothetical protein